MFRFRLSPNSLLRAFWLPRDSASREEHTLETNVKSGGAQIGEKEEKIRAQDSGEDANKQTTGE